MKKRSNNRKTNYSRGGRKRKPLSKGRIIFSIIVLIAVIIYNSIEEQKTAMPETSGERLEFPALSGSEKLVNYNGFTVSYNSRAKLPFWVAYKLEAAETEGENTRTGKKFRPDNSLPYPQAEDDDYRNSGWARGHMAPAADFKWSEEAMSDTFYFTNCCPQDISLNGGMWSTLEKKTRTYAKKYDKVYVITGPIIGKKKNGTIGDGKVVVPDSFFKALLVHDGVKYHSIAFIMDNCKQGSNMQSCAMSVDKLEERIGYDLFANLDDSIEDKIEKSYELGIWAL